MSTASSHPCPRCGAHVTPDATHCGTCGQPQPEPDEAPEAWLGRVIDGRYELLRVLGVGGMGMVFEARRVLVGDAVALKVLFPRFLESRLQRELFQGEAIAAARLSHPHVVTVFDADISSDGVAYIAMELLRGQTFKALLKERAPMPVEEVVPVMVQICDGLAAAHAANVIHRDLKPDNIILEAMPSGPPRVKLVDFGIAAMLDADPRDEQKRLLGTLRYMAPEQARNEPVDARTDLYALGVVFYESLTRRRATGKTLSAVINDPVVPPNTYLDATHRLPEAVESLVLHLLEKEPERRPASALAVKARLLGLREQATAPPVERSTSVAPPSSAPSGTPRWILAVGLVVALAMGAVGALLYAL